MGEIVERTEIVLNVDVKCLRNVKDGDLLVVQTPVKLAGLPEGDEIVAAGIAKVLGARGVEGAWVLVMPSGWHLHHLASVGGNNVARAQRNR